MILQPKDNDSFVIPEPDRNVIGFYHEYEEHGCFSNWYHAEFDYAGKHFTSAEQFMMYHKVMMFRQYDLGERILQSDSPSEMKKLGRTYFPEFNADVWDKASYTLNGVSGRSLNRTRIFSRNCLIPVRTCLQSVLQRTRNGASALRLMIRTAAIRASGTAKIISDAF